jgi:Fe-S oxidoreductases
MAELLLFDEIVFGPVHSRRLGVSLGINLLPPDGKLCLFDCIYCECGLNENRRTHTHIPTREVVREALRDKLEKMKADGVAPDVITFAGNGEPTVHPRFEEIIDDTIALRDSMFPDAKVAVLSGATMIGKESVFRALNKVDDNILKFDSVLDSRIKELNAPVSPDFNFAWLMEHFCRFKGNLMIQTMFLEGEYNGKSVANTTEEEISGWVEALKKINPKQVMIYTIDRETPVKGLKKASKETLDGIAERVRKEGLPVSVSY